MSNGASGSIAIIGAGVSGLAAAWGLRNYPGRVVLYDKNEEVGGNCQSRWIASGDDYRFCDLGVNDFNTRAYSHVVEAMDEVGIGYSLLEDSACFYTPDGSLAYTIGGLDYHRPMPAGLAAEYARFKSEAAKYYLSNPNTRISIGQYLGSTASPAYSPDFGRLCIFPRVNAMYFFDPAVRPEDMPFKAVMHYYILQEGFGTPYGPLRMYFHDGAQNWLKRLSQYLNRPIVTGASLTISASKGLQYTLSYSRSNGEAGQEDFDKIIFACHADQIAGMLDVAGILQPLQQDVLQYIRYAPSTAYAHTYTGILPPDVNLWRTYNVTINVDPGTYGARASAQAQPYSMTYLCNKHQNDVKSGPYNRYGGPQILVSLNPRPEVRAILDNEIAGRTETRYMLWDANTHEPIKWEFPHNLLDLAGIDAQARLNAHQGVSNLYFTGGWTYGSGLHEECWLQSQAVAQALLTATPFTPPQDTQDVPGHIHRATRPR